MKLVYFIALIVIEWESISAWNWCDENSLTPDQKVWQEQYIHHVVGIPQKAEHACYFFVSCAVDDCNAYVGLSDFRFDLAKAREICRSHSATLPTIKDHQENTIVGGGSSQHASKYPMVLGLTKVPGKAQIQSWDDGMPPSQGFQPTTWTDAEKYDDVTFVKSGGEWQSSSFHTSQFLNVYCKQAVNVSRVK